MYKLFKWIVTFLFYDENNSGYWINFNGKAEKIGSLTDQHLSNIYYYYKIIIKQLPPEEIRNEIKFRFGKKEKVLPYKPIILDEISILRERGMLKPTKKEYEIWTNKKIGFVPEKTINYISEVATWHNNDYLNSNPNKKAEKTIREIL